MINPGDPIGTSSWITISQEMINDFARVTGDDQWIHVDVERAAQSMPGGSTIAHGLLITGLFPTWLRELKPGFGRGMSRTFNYGFNRVRFITPVPVGSRIRGHFVCNSVEPKDDGMNVVFGISVELENLERPAAVAELVIRYQK